MCINITQLTMLTSGQSTQTNVSINKQKAQREKKLQGKRRKNMRYLMLLLPLVAPFNSHDQTGSGTV